MKAMKKCITILILLLTISTSHAQVPGGSSQSGITAQEQLQKAKEALAKDEKEFYSQPPFVRISFFINDKEIPLNDDFSFRLLVDSAEIQPASIDGSRFLFPPISEPFSIVFKKGAYQFSYDNLSARCLEHGAEMLFGVITKLDLLKTEAPFDGKFDSEYEKRTAYQEGRWQVSQERFTKALDRKNTKNVVFFVLLPRVYGDGTVRVTTQVNLKRAVKY
jgi:hypothetical protein